MKKIHILLLLIAAALASCTNDSFKIDGKIDNLDDGAVKVVFYGDSGIVDELVEMDKKGHFSFKGVSSQPAIVNVLGHQGEVLATLVAVNGDHIKINGDAGKAKKIKISGNRLNEEWQLFRDEHAAFYADPNPSRLDAAIEKYVREHPGDMLSTALLMADYSDFSDQEKVSTMLKSIESDARPESLTIALGDDPTGNKKQLMPRLMTMTLMKHGGDFEEFKLTGHITFFNFWANPQNERKTLIDKLQALDESIQVIDVLTESDTLRWHQTIGSDPKNWKHYWAPGGPLEQGVQLLRISSVPWFAVTDSTGLFTYSGSDISAAIKAAQR